MNEIDKFVVEKKNRNKLKTYAMRFTRDNDAAEDLVQEVIFKMLKNKSKYKTGTNIQGWAFIILKNTFIGQYNVSKREVGFDIDFDEEENGNFIQLVENNNADSEIDADTLKKIVENLPIPFKSVMELLILDCKYDEMADILEIPMGTVKTWIHKARKLITKELEKLNV